MAKEQTRRVQRHEEAPRFTRVRSRLRNCLVILILFIGSVWWLGKATFQWLDIWVPTTDPSELSTGQTARLQRVADLMLDIYKILAQMRYLDEEAIIPGPHDIEDLLPAYKEHGLDGSVVYLYSILPYIAEFAGPYDFFQGGYFADFRDPEDVAQGRDPFFSSPEGKDFNDENGPYMRPWVTPLSALGNHGSVLIYDAKRHRIWIIDSEFSSSRDLALSSATNGKPGSKNNNAFEHIPSRPAEDVLRDIKHWYRTLQTLPGGGEHSGLLWNEWDIDLRGLYRKNGWPDHFEGDAFQVDHLRKYSATRAHDSAQEPLRVVERLDSWLERINEEIRKCTRALAAAETKTKDEEWTARFKLWNAERDKKRRERDLAKAEQEAERLCPRRVCQKPADLPLWELDHMGIENQSAQDSVHSHEEWLNKTSNDNPDLQLRIRKKLRLAVKKAAIYQKAYDASKADAERLCPGRTFESSVTVTAAVRTDQDILADLQEDIDSLRQWAEQIPEEANETRELVVHDAISLEKAIEAVRERMKSRQHWLVEHGKAD